MNFFSIAKPNKICSKRRSNILEGIKHDSVMFLLCFRARLFIDALWSPAGKGLTSWLSFAMSICEVVTFQLVSCVGCGARFY